MSILAGKMTLRSVGEAFTHALGVRFGERLTGGEIIVLIGDLGTGKTTFVRGLAEGLGADPTEVTSPTFLRVQEYEGRVALHHVDAYRFEGGAEEFRAYGGDELLEDGGVTVIEWGDRLFKALPESFLTLRFAHGEGENERTIRLLPRGVRYAGLAVGVLRETMSAHGEALGEALASERPTAAPDEAPDEAPGEAPDETPGETPR